MGPVLLMALGVGLIALEVFVPSAGLLSVLAAAAIIGAIVMAFSHSLVLGTLMLLAATVAVPLVVAAAISWWPSTPIGRMILIKRPEHQDDVLPDTEEYRWRTEMVGKTGRAKTDLLPSGHVLIDGRRFDAVSNGVAINAGTPIRVIDVSTLRLVVRPLSEAELPADASPSDPLSTPLENLGIDPWENPLA
jgi:membrane-bound ClpP family serine protease